MEDFNSTSYSSNEGSHANPFSNIVGFAIAVSITVLLVAFLTKKDYATHQANLHRIEELERRKSCPKRRKRAINKLIETKRIAKGDCEEQQTSPSHMNQNANSKKKNDRK